MMVSEFQEGERGSYRSLEAFATDFTPPSATSTTQGHSQTSPDSSAGKKQTLPLHGRSLKRIYGHRNMENTVEPKREGRGRWGEINQ